MFCPKCGKELSDAVEICPACGNPAELQSCSRREPIGFSSPAAQVARFSEEVKAIWIFSLIFVLLFWEIGLAFGIIVFRKLKKLPKISADDITDHRDYAEYQRACVKLSNARLLFRFGVILFILAVLVGIIILIANL